jgi:hypothetical protein
MRVTEISRSDHTDLEVKNYDVKIMLGYVVFVVVMLIAIGAASISPGASPADFASMSFFP